MKPVFKCDYCNFMGIEEEVKKHEITCTDNYDKKSCYTCKYRKTKFTDGSMTFNCEVVDIPEGKFLEFCDSYERKEKSDAPFKELFRDIFGGM